MKQKKQLNLYITSVVLLIALALSTGLSAFANSADSTPQPENEQLNSTTSIETTPEVYNDPPTTDAAIWDVIFLDKNGTQIGDTQKIPDGQPAAAPLPPQIYGHEFTGWDPEDYSCITQNTTFIAQYTELTNYTVTLRYQISDGLSTAPPDKIITVYPGQEDVFTIYHPVVFGYEPTELFIVIKAKEISENTLYNIVYQPTNNVPYRVNYRLPALNHIEEPTVLHSALYYGTVGDTVTAVPYPEEVPGFTAPSSMPSGILAANSSMDDILTLNVDYTRNEYTLSFQYVNNAGATITHHKIEAPYETVITNIMHPVAPTRVGYTFDGWQLEGTVASIPAAMPAKNLTYTAKWEKSEAKYTLNLYLEDPNQPDGTYPAKYFNSIELSGKVGSAPAEVVLTEEMKDMRSAFAGVDGFVDVGTYKWEDFYALDKAKTDSEIAAKNITIAPDGSTTVNVYFKRLEYNFIFRMLAPSKDYRLNRYYDDTFQFKVNDTLYPTETYSITGKLGKNVESLWPMDVVKTSTTPTEKQDYVLYGYRISASGLWTGKGRPATLHTGHIGGASSNTANNNIYIDAYPDSDRVSIRFPLRMYTQPVDTTLPLEDWEITDTSFGVDIMSPYEAEKKPTGANGNVSFWNDYGSWRISPKKGFTSYREPEKKNPMGHSNCWLYHYYIEDFPALSTLRDENGFIEEAVLATLTPERLKRKAKYPDSTETPTFQTIYWIRNSYPVELRNVGNTQKSLDIVYEQVISAVLNDDTYTPQPPTGFEGYSFAGWYTDQALTQKANVNQKMGAAKIVWYAKWSKNTHTIQFDVNGGKTNDDNPIPNEYVENETCLTAPPAPTRDGYIFNGWIVKSTGLKFSFDTHVTADMELVASWKPRTDIRYGIAFKKAGTNTDVDPVNFPVIVMPNNTMGKSVTAFAPDIPGYLVDYVSKHKTLTHNYDDNIITFEYVPFTPVQYTIYCYDSSGRILQQETKTAADPRYASIVENCLIIPGYTATQLQQGILLTSNPENNIIKFYYTQNSLATYKVVHHQQNAAQNGYDAVLTESFSATAGTMAYATQKTYAGFTFNPAISQTQLAVQSNGSTVLNLYYTRNESASNTPTDPSTPADSSSRPPTSSRPDSSVASSTSSSSSSSPSSSSSAGSSSSSGNAAASVSSSPENTSSSGGGNSTVPTSPAERDAYYAQKRAEAQQSLTDSGVPMIGSDNPIPLYGGFGGEHVWSLLNLILTIAGILHSIGLGILWVMNLKKQYNNEVTQKIPFRIIGILAGAVSLVVFLLTQDLRTLMVVVDKWTLWMVVIAVLQVIFSILARFKKQNQNDENSELT